MDRSAPRPPIPGTPTDEDIAHAVQMHAANDRDWALCWAVLKLAEAVRKSGKGRGK
jgi:hypothetical protein